jgi:glycosyltransferase involved in cell wall biosynthesis
VGKALLDLRMLAATRDRMRRLGARVLVAHNVEAALIARASRIAPWIYVAHTSFEDELPSYGPAHLGPPLTLAGKALDTLAVGAAARVVTVAPALTQRLRRRRGDVETLLPPWPMASATDLSLRAAARHTLGFAPDAEVLLYAGNLDGYQGWEDVLGVMARLKSRRPKTRLLVATASAPESLYRRARDLGVTPQLTLTGLTTERARRRAYAAADLALVPRRVAGGVPVKLLDALARRTPVVTTRRAAGGLPLEGACLLARDDDVTDMARACEHLLDEVDLARHLAESGALYLEARHAPHLFAEAFEHLIRSTTPASPTGR